MANAMTALPPCHGRTTPQGPPTVAPEGWDPSHVTFHDALSALNPLQYLPVVGTIYREATGDSVNPALRIAVAGAAGLLLGPLGLVAAMIGAAADEIAHGGETGGSAARWAAATQSYRAARAG